MSRFHDAKQTLSRLLPDPGNTQWQSAVEGMPLKTAINALFSFLPRGGLIMFRAAALLGRATAALATENSEQGRIVMRRFIWHMNEESGNLGWGVPEAFAEALAQSPLLAAEYGRVFASYAHDSGREDNFCDFGPLRGAVYRGIGRLAPENPDLAAEGIEGLVAGLADCHVPARGLAAWALGCFGQSPTGRRLLEPRRAAIREGLNALLDAPGEVELFSGGEYLTESVRAVAAQAIARVFGDGK